MLENTEGKSKMDKEEKQATLGTQNEDKQKQNIYYSPLCANKNKVNICNNKIKLYICSGVSRRGTRMIPEQISTRLVVYQKW